MEMTRWIVTEEFRRNWREFAIVPAADKATAIATARRYGMRPKGRRMKATKLVVTKK
jgi:hypothetical protein